MEKAEQALEDALLDAHCRQDSAALTKLYQRAAAIKKADGDIEAHWFLLTQAYVFALECGDTDSEGLHATLLAGGRDE